MFREMRKINHELSKERCLEILKENYDGVMSVNGEDGYPYGVPMTYAFIDGKLIMHSTKENTHKIEALRKDNRVSFTVVAKHEIMREDYSMDYVSVIGFGRVRLVEDEAEKKDLLRLFMQELAPTRLDVVETFVVGSLIMLELEFEHLTGKAKFI